MGFYPVCPGSDQYVLGAPYLPYMDVTLSNGKHIIIKAPNVSDKNRYVRSVKITASPTQRCMSLTQCLTADVRLSCHGQQTKQETRSG